ncbi:MULTISPECIES: NAD(P)/FAD-dependent oxidoreductase [Pseudoalteromonas]|uniref:NAD(FAD)-dependent dehydrogenase n=1 Tax=Pseudoalteromonas luteoviolacea (strain 2ta16) TaxID=1353533 RepID=V4H0B1_PSEL2|nr:MULTISPECIES: FAD-dependent oxidoreductase [Pseudoalteromonas]ESP90841.1 NAD(FAD)-dependent dehydrogenase [Pseudoalteromonas luteoviolacea 2ta16]KZN38401.1 hypothetical protein N483_20810 [Pseudoalteromonas luteoviolacea NCIMB 1944]MCG7547829.1 FAD-dependent oxidoreductase [Pseudoalteromonas sp. Of7M-16]
MQRCVIIGGGHAGAQACTSLRREGWTGQIILLTDEDSLPYHRPPLSKTYLQNKVSAQQLLIRPLNAYRKDDVEVKLNTRVERIEPAIQSIVLQTGERLSYDKLLICTGSRARKADCMGADLNNVFYIKTLKDIEKLSASINSEKGKPNKRRIVMVGGGYIGLETAAVLKKMGHDVSIIERESRLLARVTAQSISSFYHKLHKSNGIKIFTDTNVIAFQGKDTVSTVLCEDKVIPADIVVVGIGAKTNVELAKSAGLLIENDGIVINELCQTTDNNIYAAGDCTIGIEHHSGLATRIESVPNALEQAKTAAATICGKHKPVTAVPWFWSDQFDCKIQIAGLNQGYDETILRQCNEQALSLWYLKQGKVIAADCINCAKEFMAAKKIIALKLPIPKETLLNTDIDLFQALAQLTQPS